MIRIKAISLTARVNDWLANSHHPRILHVFDHVCNLINGHRDVLSVVTPQIGNGPFNLVVEEDVLFPKYLDECSSISIQESQLTLGILGISIDYKKTWNPCPDWGKLHTQRKYILDKLALFPMPFSPFPFSHLASGLSLALVNANIPTALSVTHQLAGLGIGLTPAGDDFVLGAMLATWIIHPPEIANTLAKAIVDAAAPSTTSLSGAYLKSAGRGEAGILWHEYFDALSRPDSDLETPIANLLSVGETSGADALAGFFGVFAAYKERISSSVTNFAF